MNLQHSQEKQNEQRLSMRFCSDKRQHNLLQLCTFSFKLAASFCSGKLEGLKQKTIFGTERVNKYSRGTCYAG